MPGMPMQSAGSLCGRRDQRRVTTAFDPESPVTREQMVTMIVRYAEKIGAVTGARDDLSQFSDGMRVSSYALAAVRWAVAVGLLEHGQRPPRAAGARDPRRGCNAADAFRRSPQKAWRSPYRSAAVRDAEKWRMPHRLMLASAAFCDIIFEETLNKSSAVDGGYFPPIHRFEKLEIHKVFLHFSNLDLTENLSPSTLADLIRASLSNTARYAIAELCSAALKVRGRHAEFTGKVIPLRDG